MRSMLTWMLSTLLFCMTAHVCRAQAYPDSSASWCFSDFNNSEFTRIQMILGPDPDTVIAGQTYKRILEYTMNGSFDNSELVQRFYVRSDTSGKGYVMLLDSMQEYLAVDVAANAGDTIPNVLTSYTWGPDPDYEIRTVVVDSILLLENNGITVNRLFIHAIGWEPLVPYIGYYMFWQSGIGGSTGPLLQLEIIYGNTDPDCLRLHDTYVYSEQSGNPGLPGIPCDCSLLPVGIEELHSAMTAFITPNPSTGQFILVLAQKAKSIAVYSATGQQIWQGSGNTIDLTTQPPGVYTAVVATERGRQAVRLVVVR
ncbi:MAG TPA: T9SS type A sorting domain-containing protein [Flavobacteriales bacterium]|nr:T9SS type A sorting domain-containing protein [Flavobacteriales bacterium]